MDKRPPNLTLAHLFKLRLAIARLGEMDNAAWWNTKGLLSSGGANTLVGLGGDDLYYVNNSADVVTEAANGGYDTVVARGSFALPANVEALYMIGTGLTGTGSGNADLLLSSGGPNTLIGLGGDDRCYVNDSADVVTWRS